MKRIVRSLLPSFLFVSVCTTLSLLLIKYSGRLLSGVLKEYTDALCQLENVFLLPNIPVFLLLTAWIALMLMNGKHRLLKLILMFIPCFAVSLLAMNVNGICFGIGLRSILSLLM